MGVKVFSVRLHAKDASLLWGDPPTEKVKALHRVRLLDQVKYILDNQPEALLLIRTMSGPSPYWTETHPDHMQTDEKNEIVNKGDASLSSDLYVQDVCAFLKRTVDFCESQPWADRLVGYFDAGPGEGHAWLAVTGNMFDCSPVNQKAFNAWVRNKYSTDAELQSAWRDTKVTLETACVPRDSQWHAKRSTGMPSLGGEPFGKIEAALETNASQKGRGFFHWVESADARKELDYCNFQREMCLRKFKSMSKAIKDACAERGVERIIGFDMAKQQMIG